MENISLVNSILQTVIMIVTVFVTWRIYVRKQKDIKKDSAKRILVEYEKSVESIEKVKGIVSADATQMDLGKLFSVSNFSFDYWENNGHILYRELNDSEFKNIDLYFQKLEKLFEMLQAMKSLAKVEYEKYYINILNINMGIVESDKKGDNLIIMQPAEYTVQVLQICEDLEMLINIFPVEKIEKLTK